jgi:hypothetical protein
VAKADGRFPPWQGSDPVGCYGEHSLCSSGELPCSRIEGHVRRNNKAVDYLYRSLCESEFEWVRTEDLACKIWEQLKNAHAGNAQVQAQLFATYRRTYENFTHLPGESIDAMF